MWWRSDEWHLWLGVAMGLLLLLWAWAVRFRLESWIP